MNRDDAPDHRAGQLRRRISPDRRAAGFVRRVSPKASLLPISGAPLANTSNSASFGGPVLVHDRALANALPAESKISSSAYGAERRRHLCIEPLRRPHVLRPIGRCQLAESSSTRRVSSSSLSRQRNDGIDLREVGVRRGPRQQLQLLSHPFGIAVEQPRPLAAAVAEQPW